MLQVHTLRLSKADRMKKMAAMYDFVTSERCTHLLERVESESGKLLDMRKCRGCATVLFELWRPKTAEGRRALET